MATALPVIAITAGEPAGIGPDLLALLAARPALPAGARWVAIADRHLLASRAAQLGVDAQWTDFQPDAPAPARGLEILHVPLAAPAEAGVLNAANGRYVLNTLDAAIDGCLAGQFAAMVTAPVHKGVINDAGVAFSGHTEYLAERTHTPRVVMMLTGGGMRVALATTHLPLAQVAPSLTPTLLDEVLRIVHADLRDKFGIAQPHILVAGLNPHAGEAGMFGTEEIEEITPAIEAAKAKGIDAVGPIAPDTVFYRAAIKGHFDIVVCMYHDQGHIPMKVLSFETGVNVTVGLPFIRTSVDHGTAFGKAGKGTADHRSLNESILLGAKMAETRRLNLQKRGG